MLLSNIRPLLWPMRIVLGVLAVFVLVQVALCIPPSYEVRIGSLARSGTSRVIAICWECELVCRILHPSFPALGWSIAQNLLLVPALALGPPQLHHICVAVHGVLRRRTVGCRTDLKIMVSPVRIRVPSLRKYLQIARKSKAPVL
jgi:hypothetical protein